MSTVYLTVFQLLYFSNFICVQLLLSVLWLQMIGDLPGIIHTNRNTAVNTMNWNSNKIFSLSL